mmetsp:Transcript_17298/g.55836  ORF Transcript_17298/g.55836 Transcript_17298/m.55836 type:complete len:282 (+) Transcript_17298:61-906(+)
MITEVVLMTRSHTEEPDASCAGVLWGAAGGRGRPRAPSDPLRVRHCLAAAAAAFFALSAATICLYRLTHSARVLPGTASSIRSHRSSTEAGNLAKACSSARCCSALHSALAGGGGGSALPPPCAGAANLCAPALAGAGFGGAALGGAAGVAAAAARCWRCSRCRAARFSSSLRRSRVFAITSSAVRPCDSVCSFATSTLMKSAILPHRSTTPPGNLFEPLLSSASSVSVHGALRSPISALPPPAGAAAAAGSPPWRGHGRWGLPGSLQQRATLVVFSSATW